MIVACLKRTGGNVARAARMLGLERSALNRRSRSYGIEIEREEPETCGSAPGAHAALRIQLGTSARVRNSTGVAYQSSPQPAGGQPSGFVLGFGLLWPELLR